MLDADTLRKIRRIELYTKRLVSNSFAGAYHAVFKGRGISFDAVRPYEPGDDVRDIDWNVTARSGEPFIKRYVEERELTVMLVLDSSASCLFGTVNQQKRDLAAELCAVLAYAAISNNDRVGLLTFGDQIEQYIPPRKGRNHVLRLIRELLTAQSEGGGTDLALALRTSNRVLSRGAIVFLFSDFLVPDVEYERELMALSRYHDVITVVLADPREEVWPRVGLVGLHDAESGETEWVDTAARKWQREFKQQTHDFRQTLDTLLTRAGVDRIDIPLDGDYISALTLFFQRRARRIRRL